MSTAFRPLASAAVAGVACSSSRACGAGRASTTRSKPVCTACAPVPASACSCQRVGDSASRSMRSTRVSVSRRPAAASGCVQRRGSACMSGAATQCGSRAGGAASSRRPRSSSTRTALALQRRARSDAVASSARFRRASRTVKYCVPRSKVPQGESSVAIRPPACAAASSTVTVCPAWASVRAQLRPAMPAPTTAVECTARVREGERVVDVVTMRALYTHGGRQTPAGGPLCRQARAKRRQ